MKSWRLADMDYVIAKYIRLSIEDAKTDSLSIENQRLLLDSHIAGMDAPDATILEFVDNGYSGTNFERPAVTELLEHVCAGNVNCIVVKDFSRFGRNAIESGYFLQRVFPLFRTRFIAVSDMFDSIELEGDTGGIDISFKLLVHEQYSRDLSRKIKASRREKARRGEAISKNCAFGFKKVGDHLEIDEPAADTVRLIFNMAAEGKNYAEIAERLYVDKRPYPSEYRKAGGSEPEEGFSCVWNKPVLFTMLKDEQYAGTYVAGKSMRTEIGTTKHIDIDESEWIRIPDFHPIIVTSELFYTVQRILNTKTEPIRRREVTTSDRYNNIDRPLKGKVFCGCCDHRLRVSSTRNAVFSCQFTSAAPDSDCYRMRISDSELSSIVLEAIRGKAKGFESAYPKQKKANTPIHTETELSRLIGAAENEKKTLYEQFIRCEISIEGFKTAKAPLDSEIERLVLAYNTLKAEIGKKAEIKELRKQLRELTETAFMENTLSQPLVDLLIDRVSVFPDCKVDIVWKLAAFDHVDRKEKDNQ